MDFIAVANAALEKRSRLFMDLQNVNADASLTLAERQERAAKLNADLDALGAEAEQAIRQAEREAEYRELNARAAALAGGRGASNGSGMEWRALLPNRSELRALQEGVNEDGGWTVPTKVSGKFIDLLRNRSVLLKAPGINVLPFDSGTFRLPKLAASVGVSGPTAEGAVITEGDTDWAGPEVKAYGYKTLHRASNEILMDSALNLRGILADTMTRDIATRIDLDAFGSATTGRITGLTATGNHTKVSLAAGKTVVSWNDVVGAVADIEASGGMATAVFANGAMAKALRMERENGTTGAFLQGPVTGDPAKTAQGLPIFASNNVPTRSVIVADMTRVFVGTRSVKLSVSEDAYFDTDQVGFRLVHRIGGLVVGEPTSVRWIEAAAA